MFGRHKLPVSEEVRDWVDAGLIWCQRTFGPATSWPTIEPIPANFPTRFTGTESELRQLVERLCGWLRINPSSIEVGIFEDDKARLGAVPRGLVISYSGQAGEWSPGPEGKSIVSINAADLTDPMGVVAALAHELCHQLIFLRDPASMKKPDGEGLTDLLTTHVGLGIYTANAAFRFSNGGHSYAIATYYIPNTPRLVKHQGYLAPQTFAYALACRALACNETNPSWAKFLSPNPAGYLHESLAWLDDQAVR